MNTYNKVKTSDKDSFEPAGIKVITFEAIDIMLTSPGGSSQPEITEEDI